VCNPEYYWYVPITASLHLEILDHAGMTDCKPCSTPIDTNAKLSANGPHVSDATDYRALAGALQYLTFTGPDISYAVQQICLCMHDPREPHLALIKRVLRYIKGTMDYGMHLLRSSSCDLVACTQKLKLMGEVDNSLIF
jgi:hypothetical protein